MSERGPIEKAQRAQVQAAVTPLTTVNERVAIGIRVVLEHLRDDGGAWLTHEGAVYVDRLLDELRADEARSNVVSIPRREESA